MAEGSIQGMTLAAEAAAVIEKLPWVTAACIGIPLMGESANWATDRSVGDVVHGTGPVAYMSPFAAAAAIAAAAVLPSMASKANSDEMEWLREIALPCGTSMLTGVCQPVSSL